MRHIWATYMSAFLVRHKESQWKLLTASLFCVDKQYAAVPDRKTPGRRFFSLSSSLGQLRTVWWVIPLSIEPHPTTVTSLHRLAKRGSFFLELRPRPRLLPLSICCSEPCSLLAFSCLIVHAFASSCRSPPITDFGRRAFKSCRSPSVDGVWNTTGFGPK